MRAWQWMVDHDIDQHIYGVLCLFALFIVGVGLLWFLDWLTHGQVIDAFYPPSR